MKNMQFGKLVDGAVQYAPMPLVIDGRKVFTNREDIYLAQGYKKIVRTAEPEPVEGFVWTFQWVESDTEISMVWEKIEIVPDENDPTNIIDILTGEVE